MSETDTDFKAAARHSRVMQAICARPWAIQPDALEQIVLIAERKLESPGMGIQFNIPEIDEEEYGVESGVAVIPVHGSLFPRANLFTEMSGAVSAEMLTEDILAADASPDVDAIVLDIDSPGGQMGGISDVHDAVAGTAKPITAYISDLGASAAYWIASAADQIVMNRSAWVGSIGAVVGLWRNEDGFVEITSTQSPFKRNDLDDEPSMADMQREIDAAAQIFIDDVAKGRSKALKKKVTPADVEKNYGRGGVLLADKAVAAGMADRIASLRETIQAASKSGVIAKGDRVVADAVHLINAEVNPA